MVVMSTTVLHTVLATLRGVDTGTCTAAGDNYEVLVKYFVIKNICAIAKIFYDC